VRARFTPDQLRAALFKSCHRHMPSLILIENNGPGPGLARAIEAKTPFKAELVNVPPKSKRERFLKHIDVMREGKIMISEKFNDREVYVDEMINFSHAKYKDQGDATVQYLDRVLSGRSLPDRPRRALHSREDEAPSAGNLRYDGNMVSAGNLGVLVKYSRW